MKKKNYINMPLKAFIYMCRLLEMRSGYDKLSIPFNVQDGFLFATDGKYAICWECDSDCLDGDFFAEVHLPRDYISEIAKLQEEAISDTLQVNMEFMENLNTCMIHVPERIRGYGKDIPFSYVPDVLPNGVADRLIEAVNQAWDDERRVNGFLFPEDFMSVVYQMFAGGYSAFFAKSPVSGKICLAPFLVHFFKTADWNEWNFMVMPYEIPDNFMDDWKEQMKMLSPERELPPWKQM